MILGSFRSSRATASAGALSPFDTSMYGNNGGFGFPGFPSYSGEFVWKQLKRLFPTEITITCHEKVSNCCISFEWDCVL